jgi:hypothetical protein
MDISEAIDQRKSIRAFKPDPVPKEILDLMDGTRTTQSTQIYAENIYIFYPRVSAISA